MRICVNDILKGVRDGLTNAELVPTVQQYIDDWELDITPQQWALDNYQLLRKVAYPSRDGMIDSLLKLHSGFPAVEVEGRAEIDEFFQLVQDVRTRFPKP